METYSGFRLGCAMGSLRTCHRPSLVAISVHTRICPIVAFGDDIVISLIYIGEPAFCYRRFQDCGACLEIMTTIDFQNTQYTILPVACSMWILSIQVAKSGNQPNLNLGESHDP